MNFKWGAFPFEYMESPLNSPNIVISYKSLQKQVIKRTRFRPCQVSQIKIHDFIITKLQK